MNPRHRKYLTAATGTLAAMALASCGSTGGGAPASASSIEEMEEVSLTYSDLTAATSPSGAALQTWMDELNEETGGKLTVEPYFSSSLLTSDDALQGTADGVADITYTVATYFPQELPVTNWLNQRGSLPVDSFPHNHLQISGGLIDALTDEVAEAEFESLNLKLLATPSTSGKYDMICNKKLESQADLNGVRVRAPGPVWAAEAEALGMTVVNVAQDEAYEALQRGVIDCGIASPATYANYGHNEVAKHYYPASFSANLALLAIMNLDTWNSLPADAQRVLKESMEDYTVKRTQGQLDAEMEFHTSADAMDIVTYDVTEMNEVLFAFQEEQEAGWLDRAPVAVENPEAFEEHLLTTLDDWSQAVEAEVPLAGPGEVASEDVADFVVWNEKIAELYGSN